MGVAWLLSDDDLDPALALGGLRFRKQVAYAGEFLARDPGRDQRFTLDTEYFEHAVRTHDELLAAGVDCPMPIKHTDDPEARRGSWLKFERGRDSKGRESLFGVAEFRDEKAAELAKTANVSLYIPPEYTHAETKKTYHRPIRHVALTDYPVLPGLDGWEAVAASHTGRSNMAKIKDLAKTLGIELKDDADDEVASKAITKHVKTLSDRVATLEKEIGKRETTEEKKPPAKIAAGFIALARESRESKLDAFVTSGHLTPAAREELKKTWCTDGAISLSLSEEGPQQDAGWESVLATIKANGPVLSFRERTGPQTTARLPGGGITLSQDENPLIKDAKARAAAHKVGE